MPMKPMSGSNSNNRYLLGTPGGPTGLSKIIGYEQGQSFVYCIWDFESTKDPNSVPKMVETCCADHEKSGNAIDVIIFGSRRWAEFTAMKRLPYHIVYDASQDRRIIYFVERGCNRGRLKIDHLPEEEEAPQP